MSDNEELKTLKSEIISYVDKENEHLEDKINSRLQSLEKILESIEVKVTGLGENMRSDPELKVIAAEESALSYRKFWGNFKWFIGITLVSVVTILIAGIITWSDVRDYTHFKNKIENDVQTNSTDIIDLKFQHVGDNASNGMQIIQSDLRKIKLKLKIE